MESGAWSEAQPRSKPKEQSKYCLQRDSGEGFLILSGACSWGNFGRTLALFNWLNDEFLILGPDLGHTEQEPDTWIL